MKHHIQYFFILVPGLRSRELPSHVADKAPRALSTLALLVLRSNLTHSGTITVNYCVFLYVAIKMERIHVYTKHTGKFFIFDTG